LADRLNIDSSDSFGLAAVNARIGTVQKKRKVTSTEINEFIGRPENAHVCKLKDPRYAATRALNKQRVRSLANERHTASNQACLDIVQAEQNGSNLLQSRKLSKMNVTARQSTTLFSAKGLNNKNSVPEQATRLTLNPKHGASVANHDSID